MMAQVFLFHFQINSQLQLYYSYSVASFVSPVSLTVFLMNNVGQYQFHQVSLKQLTFCVKYNSVARNIFEDTIIKLF